MLENARKHNPGKEIFQRMTLIQHKQMTTEKCFFLYHKLGWDVE